MTGTTASTEPAISAPHELVTGDAALDRLCREWRACDYLAMDTEFIRTTTFFPHVGLIQVNADEETSYLVDPLTISDWTAFRSLMLDEAVTKVFHSCSEDLQVFMASMSLVPAPVFDTQIAAAFLDEGFGISYQNLVNQSLDIELPKGETRSDWLKRPLTQTQLQYAALDVALLPRIYLTQRDQLASLGRLAWVQEECEALLQQYRDEMAGDFSDYYLNIRGGWQLDSKQLAILKELAQWRELRARKRDKPRNWIIKDKSLIDIARLCPREPDELERIDDLGRNFLRHEGRDILSLVAKAATTPAEQQPDPLPRPLDGRAKARLKKGQKFVEQEAGRLGLPAEVLARKRWLISMLQDMLQHEDGDDLPELPVELRGWRKSVLLPGLVEAMR